jgi:deoxyribonuclease-4
MAQLKKELRNISKWKENQGIKTTINPEVMGKKSQLGSVSEVIEMCSEIEGLAPCVDFGHLHARDNGFLQSEKEFRIIFEQIEKGLGIKELRKLHCHFAPLEFGAKGEIRHRAHTERDYKPHPEPFCDLIKEFKMSPTIISESRDSQDGAAIEMREYFKKIHYW